MNAIPQMSRFLVAHRSATRQIFSQEHVVRYVVKLLSPPVPPGYNAARSHLIDYMPMLNAILSGASCIDTVHILSLHGLVSEAFDFSHRF